MSLFVSKETLQDWEGGKRNLILRLFEWEEYGVRPRACGKKLTYVRCDQRLFCTFCGEKMQMLYNDYPMDFYIFMSVEFDKPLRVFVCLLHPAAYKNKDFWSDPRLRRDICTWQVQPKTHGWIPAVNFCRQNWRRLTTKCTG